MSTILLSDAAFFKIVGVDSATSEKLSLLPVGQGAILLQCRASTARKRGYIWAYRVDLLL